MIVIKYLRVYDGFLTYELLREVKLIFKMNKKSW